MFARTTCACRDCVDCCKRQPGSLVPGDFERIAAAIGETTEQARVHFWASPGALVLSRATGRVARVGTITPRLEHGRCVFLDDRDRCRVHAVAPAGCALFDTHMSAEAGQVRAVWMMHQQLEPRYQLLRATLPPATSYNPSGYAMDAAASRPPKEQKR